MKYNCEIIIELPRKRVIELFSNPDNLIKWQEGFVDMKHTKGAPGAVGSTALLKYKMGKRKVNMVESIIVNDLPMEFSATYEAKNVWNEMRNYFDELSEKRTKWRSDCTFRFSGFMKIMGWLMPGAFKKQSMKYMVDFKKFAENET